MRDFVKGQLLVSFEDGSLERVLSFINESFLNGSKLRVLNIFVWSQTILISVPVGEEEKWKSIIEKEDGILSVNFNSTGPKPLKNS